MRDFILRRFRIAIGSLKRDFAPFGGHLAAFGRTHPRISCSRVRRTIHKLLNANSVCNGAVFLASPR